MAKETYQDYQIYVLKALSDNHVYKKREIVEKVIEYFDYTNSELNETLPSGKNIIYDRIGWAITYLYNAKAIERIKRGEYAITERGLELVNKYPEKINDNILMQFPEFEAYINNSHDNSTQKTKTKEKQSNHNTPLEIIEINFNRINDSLSDELLEYVKQLPNDVFNKLILEILYNMGYGGTKEDIKQVIFNFNEDTTYSIVKSDMLGFDNIYIQVKRIEAKISQPTIHKFSGILRELNLNKGILITTSSFSTQAIESANNTNIKLIDGKKLASLMIEYNVGVSTDHIFEIKKIDQDYFMKK